MVNLTAVDSAICSDFFWDALRVMGAISKVQLHLLVWSESCPCHHGLDWDSATRAQKHRWSKCPMRGRRGPELALGVFFDEFAMVAATLSVDLLASFSRLLTEAERLALVQDFEQGHAHLLFMYSVRLGHWEQQPWMLFGTAHPNPDLSREALHHCMQTPSRHPKVRQLHTDLLEDVHCYLAGDSLHDYPRLDKFLAQLMFVPTAERSIEGEHAQVQQ